MSKETTIRLLRMAFSLLKGPNPGPIGQSVVRDLYDLIEEQAPKAISFHMVEARRAGLSRLQSLEYIERMLHLGITA